MHKQPDGLVQCVLIDFGKSNYARHTKRYLLSKEEKEQYRRDHKHIAPDLVDGISDVSTASDIYSYGRLFKNIVAYFPLSVEFLSASLKDRLKQCLKYKDSERPTASELVDVLTKAIQ